MNNGFITLHRKIKENPIFRNSELFHLFTELLLSASHESHRFLWNGKDIEIKRGQLITGTFALGEAIGQNPRTIHDRLKILEGLGMITRKSTNKFSLITIVKYSDYQDKIRKPTNEPQTNHKPSTTYNNENNVNNDNKDTATENLWNKFNQNSLLDSLKQKYPDRDYKFFFLEMCDWYLTKKKKLPQNISAFSNWLSKTKPDEAQRNERFRQIEREELANKLKETRDIPQNLPKLDEIKAKFNLKSF